MRRARASNASARGSCSTPASAALPPRRKASIATDGWPKAVRWPPTQRAPIRMLESLGFVLSRELPERSLRFLDVVQGESAGFDQVGHDGLCPSAEEAQQFVDQAALRAAARNHRFKNMSVADLLDAAHRLFRLQAIDGGLHGRICRPVSVRKGFLNLPDGGCAAIPERLHDLKFQFR